VVDLEPGRVAVRIDVPLAASELLSAVVVRVAKRVGWTEVAVLADVGRRSSERFDDRVGLRGAGEVDRRLREVEPRFREADVLDGLRGRDGDEQRLRVGISDVFGASTIIRRAT
jgi:CO/xanthine dehydrogenase FAD-binding subunit